MGIKKFRPITPILRKKTVSDFAEITTSKPYKPLTKGLSKKAGRNSSGRITCRHKGGGHKKLFRMIDFKRDKMNINAKVLTVEYDPNRSAYISLVLYNDGERRYILAPFDIKVGDVISSGEHAPIKIGNSLPLKNIPAGIEIHNVELRPFKGGQLIRSAGGSAQIMAKEGAYCQLKMPGIMS